MGNLLQLCCGPAGKEDEIITSGNLPSNKRDLTAQNSHPGSVQVQLILGDGSKLDCEVSVDPSSRAVLLKSGNRQRVIKNTDIAQLLYTADQLQNVDNAAHISNFDTCAALQLRHSGNCIPLFFKSEEDKSLFITKMQLLLS